MPVAFGRVIMSVVVVVVPGPWAWVVEDDIGTQAAVEVRRQYGSLYPGPSGIVMVIALLVVIVNANGRVIPIIVFKGSRCWIVRTSPYHATAQTDRHG